MRQSLDKERLLKLTLAVYKVAAIFPAGEELSQKIRESADKILSAKTDENRSRLIDEILKLFDLAEKKNWVDPRNFSILRREYAPYSTESSYRENLTQSSNGNRRERMVALLSSNGAVKISDFARVLPGINRRTILRDLDELYQDGTIIRNGHGRGVYYVKNGSSAPT